MGELTKILISVTLSIAFVTWAGVVLWRIGERLDELQNTLDHDDHDDWPPGAVCA